MKVMDSVWVEGRPRIPGRAVPWLAVSFSPETRQSNGRQGTVSVVRSAFNAPCYHGSNDLRGRYRCVHGPITSTALT